MGNKGSNRFFAIFIAFIMVLSMLSPMQASATSGLSSQDDLATLEVKAAIEEQLSVLNGPATMHADLEGVSGNQRVNVIVHLSEKPVALEKGIKELAGRNFTASDARKVEKRIMSQQEQVAQEMAAENISFDQGYTFTTVLNGFAAEVKASDLDKLLEIEGVALIEPDLEMYASEEEATLGGLLPDQEQVEAYMNTSNDFLGIEALWNLGIDGKGVSVAVLDTGIDANHPDLKDVYKGGKNFIVHNPNMYKMPRNPEDGSETKPFERPDHQPVEDENNREYATSHGTHVAGTIAAAGKTNGIKGIAPKVDLYSYRVLGAYGSGATSGIIAAIEYAVEQDIDVINLSLGGGSNTENSSNSFAINNAALAGVIPVIATGNSGSKRGTMGTPSTAPLGIAVGNSTNPEEIFKGKVTAVVTGDTVTVTSDTATVTTSDTVIIDKKELPLMATTFGEDVSQQLNGNSFELVAIPGVGEPADFSGLDVAGKFVLIARGDIAFVQKIINAKAAGAAGVIIHNHTGTELTNNVFGDGFNYIPTFEMTLQDGTKLRESLTGGNKVTLSFEDIVGDIKAGDEINSSSSRGPSRPNFDIKPDVVAPGTNIMSTIPTYRTNSESMENLPEGTAYDRKTGTSMATPHIAGIVALMKQVHPEWTPADVKVALSNTAKVLDVSKYDVFAQGAGRVEVYDAVFPTVRAYVQNTADVDYTGKIVLNETGTITFGSLPAAKTEPIEISKEIRVENLTNTVQSYTVSTNNLKTPSGVTVTVDKSSFTLQKGEQTTLKVTLKTIPPVDTETYGYVVIQPTGGKEISLPYAADFSGKGKREVRNFKADITDLSFNDDGKNDSGQLIYDLTMGVSLAGLAIFDIETDAHVGWVDVFDNQQAGSHTVLMDGAMLDSEELEPAAIPDGVYEIAYYSFDDKGTLSSVYPIFVKSTKPEFTANQVNGTFSGQVTDKYIHYNDVLAQYSLDYDLNEKLELTYQVTKNGVTSNATSAMLNQDGSYEFAVNGFNPTTDKIVITVEDAAGNSTEQIIGTGNGNNSGGGSGGAGGGGGATAPEAQPTEKPETEKPEEETTKPDEQEKPAPFVPTDLPANHWAASYIGKMIEKGLLKGNEKGEVKPNANVTRAQFASILARALNLKADGNAPFSDVSKYAPETQAEIAAIFEAGIAKGTDGKYMPSNEISRAQLALMLYRAYEVATGEKYAPKGDATFKDLGNYNAETRAAIAMVQELGIAAGDNGKFNPTNPATRAHASKMVINFLEVIENL